MSKACWLVAGVVFMSALAHAQSSSPFFSDGELAALREKAGQTWAFKEDFNVGVNWNESMQFAVEYFPPRDYSFCYMKFLETSKSGSGQAHFGWVTRSQDMEPAVRGQAYVARLAAHVEGEHNSLNQRRVWINGTMIVIFVLDPSLQRRMARSGLSVQTNPAVIEQFCKNQRYAFYRRYGGPKWRPTGTAGTGYGDSGNHFYNHTLYEVQTQKYFDETQALSPNPWKP